MCTKAFFPNSLPIHLKQCEKKMAFTLVPCRYCYEEHLHGEMSQHVSRCKAAKKAQKEITRCGGGAGGGGCGISRPAVSTQGTGRRIGEGGGGGGGLGGGDGGFEVGSEVELHSLLKKPELNGVTGQVSLSLD